MKVYLVGGAVRDMVMGIEPKDRDYVVVGATPQDMLDLGYKQVGADFPVFLHPDTGEEYALARVERKTGVGYHGFKTDHSPNITLEQDLLRRDLTMNSMAMDEDGTIIDPYGGQKDIQSKMIRHTSAAFEEDPVRILRACRFAARYGFHIHPETRAFMIAMVNRGELHHVTRERIINEIRKGFGEKNWVTMVREMTACGASDVVRPFHYGYHQIQRVRDPKQIGSIEKETCHLAKIAIATYGFKEMTYNDCIDWHFSKDEAKIISAVNGPVCAKFLTQQGYRQMDAEKRVTFIAESGVLNNPKLAEILGKMYKWFYYEECFATSHRYLEEDLKSLSEIDYEGVVEDGKQQGVSPRDAVKLARVAKLNQTMSRPEW